MSELITMPAEAPTWSLPAETRIGHIHLKVADLDRAVSFYRDTLGFDLITRFGEQAAFLSAGGYHHHIGLNTWESKGARHLPSAAPVSITSPSTPRRAVIWRRRSGGCSTPAGASTALPTMAPTRPSTCTIRMATVSSSPGTVTPSSGRPATASWSSTGRRWTSPVCWPSSATRTPSDIWRTWPTTSNQRPKTRKRRCPKSHGRHTRPTPF